ncbi:MAG: prepilin-type N-terminal cleavage/methylation domain-containing protein [Deltaproteobacteria bacterium]|nr:prepilin-type N-terminal cleavage/methylation domain-containing protein [Deltaproteobacteria bacterium]
MSAPGRRSRRGMNLIEVMVAVAVLVVMAAMSWEILASTGDARAILAERDETTRSARVTLSRLRRELQLAYLTPNRGAVNTYWTVFVGENSDPDTLFFASLAHQRLYRNSRESDQTEISLWAEPSRERGQGYVLFHREAPRIDEEPDEAGVVFPLAYNVRSFDLRYLDPKTNEWRDEWDSRSTDTPYYLPRAVQIGMVLIGQDASDADKTIDIPVMTTVVLQYASPLKRSLFAKEAK